MSEKISINIGGDDKPKTGFFVRLFRFFMWLILVAAAIPMVLLMGSIIWENHSEGLYDSKVIDGVFQK